MLLQIDHCKTEILEVLLYAASTFTKTRGIDPVAMHTNEAAKALLQCHVVPFGIEGHVYEPMQHWHLGLVH